MLHWAERFHHCFLVLQTSHLLTMFFVTLLGLLFSLNLRLSSSDYFGQRGPSPFPMVYQPTLWLILEVIFMIYNRSKCLLLNNGSRSIIYSLCFYKLFGFIINVFTVLFFANLYFFMCFQTSSFVYTSGLERVQYRFRVICNETT